MKPGAVLIMLDAAAAYVGELPATTRIGMMITHPCHPAFFVDRPTAEERADHFGGIARQDIIVCLVQGSEESSLAGPTYAGLSSPRWTRRTGSAWNNLRFSNRPWRSWWRPPPPAGCATPSMSLSRPVYRARPRKPSWQARRPDRHRHLLRRRKVAPSPTRPSWPSKGKRELIHQDWKRVYRRDVLQAAIKEIIHPAAAAKS